MPAPNLGNLSAIYGKLYVTSSLPSGSALSASLLSNPNGSNVLYRINNVSYANTTSIATTATLLLHSASVNYTIIKNGAVPAHSTLVVVSQDTRFYLEEGMSFHAYANQSSSIDVMIAYEVIS